MSLIALRQILRRQGRRAAMLLVALSLTPLAAHHAGVPAPSAGGTPAHHPIGHGSDLPAAPAPIVEQALAVCVAILPMLLAATLVLGVLLLHWLRVAASMRAVGEAILVPRRVLRPPRDGPTSLCVMRC